MMPSTRLTNTTGTDDPALDAVYVQQFGREQSRTVSL
jgi:hypothetical protein